MADAAGTQNTLFRVNELIQRGELDAAEVSCREFLKASPDAADAWFALGVVFMRREMFAAAEDALGRGLAVQPHNAAIWNELSTAHNKQGKGAEAEDAARRAIALDASNGAYWSSLGAALYTEQRWPETIEALRRSLAIAPQNAAVWNNLGSAEMKLGRLEAAQEALGHAMALAPGHMGSISNFVYLLCRQGRREEASQWLRQQLALDPQLPEAWILQGQLWEMMAEWGLAAAAYRRALELAPRHRAAKYQLARMLRSQRLPSAAEETVRELLAEEPGHADAWALLAELLSTQGRSEAGLPFLQRAVQLAPNDDRHARLLVGLQYAEDASPERLLAAHREWEALYAQPLHPAGAARVVEASRDRLLRLGFVSSDFGRHPIGFLVLPALEQLDRSSCSVICYSDRASEDEYTARFRAASHAWRVTSSLSDENLANQIRNDKIDILVDLMGHTGKRLLVFARKPAPSQLSWLGYVGTTGLTAMDCLLADPYHVREGEEIGYSERVLRMPHAYGCYGPPADAPEVSPLPAQSVGFITFACFNNPAKYAPRMLEAWATILRRLPTARLVLKYGGLDDPQVQARWKDWFERQGVGPERLLLEGWSPAAELLANYNRVDLALDTQPYSGGLTTCEALWMGVPVVTFPGNTFAGRHSASYLINAGYGEFVAADLPGYIELAVGWANRIDELALIRARMRENVGQSPLCDSRRFAIDLLAALAGAWESMLL
jgi:predicted O-linked N-acetylglucosamine transferase (SPINDLY family)